MENVLQIKLARNNIILVKPFQGAHIKAMNNENKKQTNKQTNKKTDHDIINTDINGPKSVC